MPAHYGSYKFIYFNFFLVILMSIIAILSMSSKRPPPIYNLSDYRFKTDIREVAPEELAKIFQLNARAFKVREDKPQVLKYGFIAQDIEKVFPGMVVEFNGRKYVDPTQLISLMIETLKIQRYETDHMKNELELLKRLSILTSKTVAARS